MTDDGAPDITRLVIKQGVFVTSHNNMITKLRSLSQFYIYSIREFSKCMWFMRKVKFHWTLLVN